METKTKTQTKSPIIANAFIALKKCLKIKTMGTKTQTKSPITVNALMTIQKCHFNFKGKKDNYVLTIVQDNNPLCVVKGDSFILFEISLKKSDLPFFEKKVLKRLEEIQFFGMSMFFVRYNDFTISEQLELILDEDDKNQSPS